MVDKKTRLWVETEQPSIIYIKLNIMIIKILAVICMILTIVYLAKDSSNRNDKYNQSKKEEDSSEEHY